MKQFKLPKEFAEKWLIALRSGEYEQGEEELLKYIEDEKGFTHCQYCCLGVAGEISGMQKIDLEGKTLYDENNFDYLDELPLPTGIIAYENNKLVQALTQLNDGIRIISYTSNFKNSDYIFRHTDIHQHFTDENLSKEAYKLGFNQIADFIEDNVEFIK